MDTVAIIISLIAGAFTALATFVVSYFQRLERKKGVERQKVLGESLRLSLNESFKDYFTRYESNLIAKDKTDYLVNVFRNYLVHYPSQETKRDVEKIVNEKVIELKKRIDAIEARFPEEATIEKIASINDAIMVTKLESMSDSIHAIQDQMLTKWDIVKIVFAILAALGVIVAIIFGTLNWLKQ